VKNQLLKNPQLMKRVLPQLVKMVQTQLLKEVEKRVPTQLLVKRVLTQLLMEVVKRQELTQAGKGRPIQLLKEAAVKTKLPQVLEMMALPKEMKKHRATVPTVKERDPVVKRVPRQGLVLRKVWRGPMLLQTVSYLQKGILLLLELGKELKKVLGLEQRVGLIQNFQPRLRIKWKERPWLM